MNEEGREGGIFIGLSPGPDTEKGPFLNVISVNPHSKTEVLVPKLSSGRLTSLPEVTESRG